jgi:hypothetical protein
VRADAHERGAPADPVWQGSGGGKGIRPAAGSTDDGEPVHAELVSDSGDIASAIRHGPTGVPRRLSVPGPVKRDHAHPEAVILTADVAEVPAGRPAVQEEDRRTRR